MGRRVCWYGACAAALVTALGGCNAILGIDHFTGGDDAAGEVADASSDPIDASSEATDASATPDSGGAPDGMPDAGGTPDSDGNPADARSGDDAPAGPRDTDGDRVLDDADNCVDVPNPDQRNHDGDDRGDACDGCPHIAEAMPRDGDGDKVNDACDPRPGVPGDRIALFDGFYDNASGPPAGWVVGAGKVDDWDIRNGQLRAKPRDGIHLIYWNTSLTNQVIDTKLSVNDLGDPDPGGPGTQRNISVVGGYDGAGAGPLWLCGFHDDVDSDDDPVLRLVELNGNGTVVGTPKDSNKLAVPLDGIAGARVRVALANQAGPAIDERCILSEDTQSTTLSDSDSAVAGGFVGLRTRGVVASFDYVVVYRRD